MFSIVTQTLPALAPTAAASRESLFILTYPRRSPRNQLMRLPEGFVGSLSQQEALMRSTSCRGQSSAASLSGSVVSAMSALMPNHAWRVVAVLCGAAGLGLVAWHQWAFARHSGPKDDFDRDQRNLDVLSVITYTLTLVAGAARLPTVLALALLWLIFSGASEALMFMRHHDVPPGRKLPAADREGQRRAAAQE
jgi:hypothetical protein